ncbi:hypothetical protein EBT23_00320 [bacterium]|jgi:hypothetical protein|nr:hypothetical protein [bacterium]
MRVACGVLLIGLALSATAQESQPLETPYTPFDFDNNHRTAFQTRQNHASWASKDNDLQRGLITGERQKKQDAGARAAALFPDPEETREPQTSSGYIPTKKQLTDEITVQKYGETTKGQVDLLSRARVAKDAGLESFSDSDCMVYGARLKEQQAQSASGEGLLRPMPTLVNSKTDGPPHMYAVSQAGVGARKSPRDGQNSFDDLIRFFHLDQSITKGTDPLPSPAPRLTSVEKTPEPSPSVETVSPANTSEENSETKPDPTKP